LVAIAGGKLVPWMAVCVEDIKSLCMFYHSLSLEAIDNVHFKVDKFPQVSALFLFSSCLCLCFWQPAEQTMSNCSVPLSNSLGKVRLWGQPELRLDWNKKTSARLFSELIIGEQKEKKSFWARAK